MLYSGWRNARRTVVALWFVLPLTLESEALAQASNSAREPDYQTIGSGHCEVKLCTDFNFGDHAFRIYAVSRANTLHLIQRGACTCKRTQTAGRDFKDYLNFGIRRPDGRFSSSISVLRASFSNSLKSSGSGNHLAPNPIQEASPNETTFERFERVRAALEPVESFIWRDDHFDQFQVFQSRRIFGGGGRLYFFVPKDDFELVIGESRQKVAFATPLVLPMNDRHVAMDGPTVAAKFKFSDSISVSQLFVPKLTPSARWIEELRDTNQFVATRLMSLR